MNLLIFGMIHFGSFLQHKLMMPETSLRWTASGPKLQSAPNPFGRSTRKHKMLQFTFSTSAIHALIPPINVEMKAEFQNCRSHIHIQHWEGGGEFNQNIDYI